MTHVLFPLVPFFLESIIRIGVLEDIDWDTFNSSTLSISIGILCLFVNRSLIGHKKIIPTEEETGRMIGYIHMFYSLTICFVAFFSIVVFSSALLIEEPGSDNIARIKHNFDLIIMISAIGPVLLSLFVQRAFNLRALL
uniref:Uncharacterized protein n=1 Tax=Candidatus Kentrum sp. FW TaxID=2126338 RepID=A0A450TCY2_9GAMM|nr:MAG: hypothetical protein BECKFW1821B_GA0114236_109616 [Candidatus Kentron sp. FW]